MTDIAPKIQSMNLDTLAIHAGELHDTAFGAVAPPLILSTTFERNSEGCFPDGRDVYTRASNPNRRALEQKLAALENGVEACAFASGQAATLAIFHAALTPHAHVILPDDCYFATRILLENHYKKWGVEVSIVDMSDVNVIERSLKKNTALIWIETPSNPNLKVTDIKAVSDLAKQHGILTVCDNTWATPFFTQPFAHGADLVIHSSSKYFGGHSDILGGCVIFKEKDNELNQKIRDFQILGGGVPSPFDCWLLFRSLATFPLRMQKHGENAQVLAEFLAKHPQIERVLYPGLEENPFHEVSKKQMTRGFGGMMSILVQGTEGDTLRMASRLKMVKHATSLGGVESLVDHRKSAEGVHSRSAGNLLRVSVGIENIEDLIADFDAALRG